MKLYRCKFEDIHVRFANNQIVCYGSGNWLNDALEVSGCYSLLDRIDYFVDRNPSLWNTKKKILKSTFEIKSPSFFFEEVSDETLILVTAGSVAAIEIAISLLSNKRLSDNSAMIVGFICLQISNMSRERSVVYPPKSYKMNENMAIPKKLHYCWFGGSSLPESNKNCIDSWKKYCPEYEIIEWNEENYDYLKHHYMREAYSASKWAYVTDYARLDIIYRYGGIYFDTDVELVKPLDELLYNSSFCGFQDLYLCAFGLVLGGAKHNKMIKDMRDMYDDMHFINEDGELNMIPCPFIQTRYLVANGLIQNGGFQVINSMAVYPTEYFNPYNSLTYLPELTENTYSIHHFDASWHATKEQVNKNNYIQFCRDYMKNSVCISE